MIKVSLVAAALLLILTSSRALAVDPNFFPPAPEAKSFDDFDPNGFIINGQRTFVASGSIHFARVPRALWRDRLLRLKRGGFNTVQTYVFWNFHEIKENTFDFTNEKDLGAFLNTAQSVGLYATVRVGPYCCAEWDFGGYPLWMKFKPNAEVRNNSPFFQAEQEHWLSRILPLVASHQINKGGNVIFVQLENEGGVWGAWTKEHPNTDPYWQALYNSAIKYGIQVPFFMSGMHHGFVPLPDSTDSSTRVNPWYSTETWAGWFDIYGTTRPDIFFQEVRFMSSALSLGANGYNFYMLHGGSNFDYWNDNEDASSYDYGTAIGQTGDLRPMYYAMKTYNTFAASFADILENATGDLNDYRSLVTNGYLRGVRKSPAGTVAFVQASATSKDPLTIQAAGGGLGGPVSLQNFEVTGIVLDAPIAPGIKIIEAATPLFGVAHDGTTTTLIAYGKAGSTGVITLKLGDSSKQVQLTYPDGAPTESLETVGAQKLRILTMSDALVPLTWIIGAKGRQSVVVGPEYVGDFSTSNGRPAMTIERPYTHDAPSQVLVYGEAGTAPVHLAVTSDKSMDTAPAPDLSAWQISPVNAPSQQDYNDSTWLASDQPTQMGADGDISSYAWYRAVIKAPGAGSATIHFAGATDLIHVFVNGKSVDAVCNVPEADRRSDDTLSHGGLNWDAKAELQAGANTLAVFVSHLGRSKAFAYGGPITDFYPKGIFKPVTVDLAGQTIPVTGWKLKGGIPAPSTLAYRTPDASYTPAGPAFFKTSFTAKPPAATGPYPIFRLDTAGLSRGSVFLNGHNLGRYPDTLQVDKKPLGIWLPECWLRSNGPNTLAVYDELGNLPTDAKVQVETGASREVIAVSQPADPTSVFNVPVAPILGIDLKNLGYVDSLTDKPATASSSAPDCAPYYVNDGQESTYWYPASTPTSDHPEWVQIDLGAPTSFKSVQIGWSCPVSHVAYFLEGSTDGTTWAQLADQRGPQEDKHDMWKTVPVPDGTSVRYLKLTLTGLKNESKVGVNTIRTL